MERNRIARYVRHNRLKVAVASTVLVLGAVSIGAYEYFQSDTGTNRESHSESKDNLSNPAKLRIAEQIVSSFENSTTDIQYEYAEDLNDGRGITAGRAGFTSGTHDLLQVVQEYRRLNGGADDQLTAYLPALENVEGSDSTQGLDGFIPAWQATARNDPELKKAQDIVYNELYLTPALQVASDNAIASALGQTILLDTIIQHGNGDDPDGLPAIVTATNNTFKNTMNVDEATWLSHFLDERRKILLNAHNESTREQWRESVERVDALRSLLDDGNLSLTTPLEWTVHGDDYTIAS